MRFLIDTQGLFSIAAAGAVVTKPFPDGDCVLAGAPARIIKTLDPANCPRHQSTHEYHGYAPKSECGAF